jgi:hypothetical protein
VCLATKAQRAELHKTNNHSNYIPCILVVRSLLWLWRSTSVVVIHFLPLFHTRRSACFFDCILRVMIAVSCVYAQLSFITHLAGVIGELMLKSLARRKFNFGASNSLPPPSLAAARATHAITESDEKVLLPSILWRSDKKFRRKVLPKPYWDRNLSPCMMIIIQQKNVSTSRLEESRSGGFVNIFMRNVAPLRKPSNDIALPSPTLRLRSTASSKLDKARAFCCQGAFRCATGKYSRCQGEVSHAMIYCNLHPGLSHENYLNAAAAQEGERRVQKAKKKVPSSGGGEARTIGVDFPLQLISQLTNSLINCIQPSRGWESRVGGAFICAEQTSRSRDKSRLRRVVNNFVRHLIEAEARVSVAANCQRCMRA